MAHRLQPLRKGDRRSAANNTSGCFSSVQRKFHSTLTGKQETKTGSMFSLFSCIYVRELRYKQLGRGRSRVLSHLPETEVRLERSF